jgi:hypothetical protein
MLDPKHPTLHLASDLAPGWIVLHHGSTGNHRAVEGVDALEDGEVVVTFTDGGSDHWGADARIHAKEA